MSSDSAACESVVVDLFGAQVRAYLYEGNVQFDAKDFVKAIDKNRAKKLFDEIEAMFSFIGQEGRATLVADGKEYLLAQTVMMDRSASKDLIAYTQSWINAYELLMGSV